MLQPPIAILRHIAIVASLTALLICARIVIASPRHDGLSELRFVTTPVRGVSFTEWINHPALDETQDVITHIDGNSIADLANQIVTGPWASTKPPTSGTYLITRKGEVRDQLVITNQEIEEIELAIGYFDWDWRWGFPFVLITFLLIGIWISIKRPHEPAARGMLILGCSLAVYHTYQTLLRSPINLDQPALFWFDQSVATLAGFTIFGAVMNLLMNVPPKDSSRWLTSRRFSWFFYVAPPLVYASFAVLRYVLDHSDGFAYLVYLQQSWQLTQVLLFVIGLGLTALRYHSLKPNQNRAAMGSLLGAGAPIIAFLIVSKNVFLLLGLDPLINYHIHRIIFSAFPVIIGLVIMRHNVFSIRAIFDKAVVFSALLALSLLLMICGILLISHIITNANSTIPPILVLLVSGLVAQPFLGNIQSRISRRIYGNRLKIQKLLEEIEHEFDPTLTPNVALNRCASLLHHGLKLGYVSILIDSSTEDDSRESTLIASCGTVENKILITLPIKFHGTVLGRLKLQTKGDEILDHLKDEQLLEPLLLGLGHLIYALRATLDLQKSRLQLQQQEVERRHIEHHLHDSLSADLAGITFLLEAELRRSKLTHQALSPSTLQEVTVELKNKIQDIRAIARRNTSNMPIDLSRYGLEGSLERFARRRMPTTDVQLTLSQAHDLPMEIVCTLYFVTMEAMNNIAHHAHATKVHVAVERQHTYEDTVRLTITDNGCGLNMNVQPGIGLRSMHQRATEAKGMLMVESQQPHGTCIILTIPLKQITHSSQ